jgi:hypothetical protein
MLKKIIIINSIILILAVIFKISHFAYANELLILFALSMIASFIYLLYFLITKK